MRKPWIKFWSRDWLNHKELRRCSLRTRAVWIDLLCLMSEGNPVGFLADKVGPMSIEFIAEHTHTKATDVTAAIDELLECKVAGQTEDGVLYSPKMVEDENIRAKRAAGGPSSLANPAVPRPKAMGPVAVVTPVAVAPMPIRVPAPVAVAKDTGTCDHWVERLYARHPKKRNLPLVEYAVVQLWSSTPNPEELFETIDRVHREDCESDEWIREAGRWAPTLDKWLNDRPWIGREKARVYRGTPDPLGDREVLKRKGLL